ncbi:type I-F CRISPR-associated endoribonuclease Cas6/Csy4 [Bacterioplanes sanyensis]|uniref:type I-F CRISPR-associated endoribonuclease Cas6/Csy4 n=1 Tax=Bacterioplanes sanyensis TaxID=1249553 RepID=UPI0016790868|nr:type I-F CRISPR-associated endoribonuclease Cas6/Csy4 [Bacterioplanes sanyensis]GGY57564.1 type I-F CRISPR-associated endoribonuclease Cas6/Csy4 [Bacterioplanes sanyensis]
MDYYLDIALLPDPEFPAPMLMNALMAKLHRALHDRGQSDIGVSFPRADRTMGNLLRLHGTQSALQQLQQLNWLKGMRDHCNIGTLSPVPGEHQWCQVRRWQPPITAAKLRRLVARGSVSEQQAEAIFAQKGKQPVHLPFLQLNSRSSGERFKLYIDQRISEGPSAGSFNYYGLSQTATVPWF